MSTSACRWSSCWRISRPSRASLEKLRGGSDGLAVPARPAAADGSADGATPAMDDPATIIFSSGSTGEPKGAMLSHYNVVSNLLQLNQVFDFKRDDRFVGVLPFFHSLGFTATLLGPAVLGVGVAYHPIPTDARTVGKLVHTSTG